MDHPDQPLLFSEDDLPALRDEAWELPDTGRVPQSEEGLEVAMSLQMELSVNCMRFIAALRDVGIYPALSFRQHLLGYLTLVSANLQVLIRGGVGPGKAPDVVAETRRIWEQINELRVDFFASLPPGPARAVLEREAELADMPFEELDDGTEDGEDIDLEDEGGLWFEDLIRDRVEQSLRGSHEEQLLPPGLRLRTLLGALPVEWLDAICETVEISHRRLRKDREKALASVLTDPEGLEDVIFQLAPEEVDALRYLLSRDGACKALLVTQRFGDDSRDTHFWSEEPPASVLGQLRLRGLVFVGRMVHGKQKFRTVAIPVELRQPMAPILDEVGPAELDPEAMLRSARRTAVSWCEGAFPASDDPPFFDEDRELAVDIVVSVAELMVTYLGELPHEWTASALMECLTEEVPLKITADDDWFKAVPDVMCALLEHVAETGRLEQGAKLAKAVASGAREIRRAAGDPANWGMAKTVAMAALAEGIDPADSQQMGDFIERWNRRAALEPPTEALRTTKVGRNQPCPCGSGKKYKRCCGV